MLQSPLLGRPQDLLPLTLRLFPQLQSAAEPRPRRNAMTKSLKTMFILKHLEKCKGNYVLKFVAESNLDIEIKNKGS
jgi:hypothetical protein